MVKFSSLLDSIGDIARKIDINPRGIANIVDAVNLKTVGHMADSVSLGAIGKNLDEAVGAVSNNSVIKNVDIGGGRKVNIEVGPSGKFAISEPAMSKAATYVKKYGLYVVGASGIAAFALYGAIAFNGDYDKAASYLSQQTAEQSANILKGVAEVAVAPVAGAVGSAAASGICAFFGTLLGVSCDTIKLLMAVFAVIWLYLLLVQMKLI